MKKVLSFSIVIMLIFNFLMITTLYIKASDTVDMDEIEIICNNYLLEGETLKIEYKLYPENSKDKVNVYLKRNGVLLEKVDISSGEIIYDYEKYERSDFEIVIKSRYNDVEAIKGIKFISKDMKFIVVDNGENSNILKYYYRENGDTKFEYVETSVMNTMNVYNELNKDSKFYVPILKNTKYYFAEGFFTSVKVPYGKREYSILTIQDAYKPYYEEGTMKLSFNIYKEYLEIEDIKFRQYTTDFYGVTGMIVIEKGNNFIGEIEVSTKGLSNNMIMMQLKLISEEMQIN